MVKPVIVLADDEETGRETIAEVLEGRGFEVHSFENGKQALDEVRTLHAQGQKLVLLTDYNMPEMDGIELVQALSAEGIRVPTVMMSANEQLAREAEKAGIADRIDRQLVKPLNIKDLRQTVQELAGMDQAAGAYSAAELAKKGTEPALRRQ